MNTFFFFFFPNQIKSLSSHTTSGFTSNTLRLWRARTKTLHKYAINQVTQCESEPQAIETTNIIATLYSKARATTLTRYKFTATFPEKKVHCSQVSNGNKNRLDQESFYQSYQIKIQYVTIYHYIPIMKTTFIIHKF